ncbi:MAG: hypothetical protein GF417_12360, partial [Candidatus Latescibacteria bacterium]|nr:hypothetical protein [Candidatus Latescibacterota bacterium]
MHSKRFYIIICIMIIAVSAAAGENELIINPRLAGGLGAFPIMGSKVVSGDTVKAGKPGDTTVNNIDFREMFPDGVEPVGLLIRGKVPYPSRRWVVAMTRDEEERTSCSADLPLTGFFS